MSFSKFCKSTSLSILVSAWAVTSAFAGEYMSVAKDGVNLRSGPSTSTTILYELPAGYPLEVIGREGSWLKVSDYEGDKGWIEGSLVNKTPHVIIKAKECNIRSGPSTSDSVVGNVVREVILVKADEKGDWIKISHPDLNGWVHKSLVWP
jgi:SH3-like domain-containing protein